MDIFPTLLGLTDTKIPADYIVDGSRLDTLLTGKPDKAREETFLMHYPHSPHRSVYFTCYRKGDWKVIYTISRRRLRENSHYQLYNLAKDPFESTNLAESNPEQLRVMMKGLIAAMKDHGALYPVDKEEGGKPLEPKMP